MLTYSDAHADVCDPHRGDADLRTTNRRRMTSRPRRAVSTRVWVVQWTKEQNGRETEYKNPNYAIGSS